MFFGRRKTDLRASLPVVVDELRRLSRLLSVCYQGNRLSPGSNSALPTALNAPVPGARLRDGKSDEVGSESCRLLLSKRWLCFWARHLFASNVVESTLRSVHARKACASQELRECWHCGELFLPRTTQPAHTSACTQVRGTLPLVTRSFERCRKYMHLDESLESGQGCWQ